MRAVDALQHMAARILAKREGETIRSDLVREGIAYDEIDRFLHLGPFLADQLREWCEVDADGEPWEDEETGERLLLSMIWIEGFFVGRRMMRSEIEGEMAAMVGEIIAAMVGARPAGDDRPPG